MRIVSIHNIMKECLQCGESMFMQHETRYLQVPAHHVFVFHLHVDDFLALVAPTANHRLVLWHTAVSSTASCTARSQTTALLVLPLLPRALFLALRVVHMCHF